MYWQLPPCAQSAVRDVLAVTLGRPEVGLVLSFLPRYQLPELLRHLGQDAR